MTLTSRQSQACSTLMFDAPCRGDAAEISCGRPASQIFSTTRCPKHATEHPRAQNKTLSLGLLDLPDLCATLDLLSEHLELGALGGRRRAKWALGSVVSTSSTVSWSHSGAQRVRRSGFRGGGPQDVVGVEGSQLCGCALETLTEGAARQLPQLLYMSTSGLELPEHPEEQGPGGYGIPRNPA